MTKIVMQISAAIIATDDGEKARRELNIQPGNGVNYL